MAVVSAVKNTSNTAFPLRNGGKRRKPVSFWLVVIVSCIFLFVGVPIIHHEFSRAWLSKPRGRKLKALVKHYAPILNSRYSKVNGAKSFRNWVASSAPGSSSTQENNEQSTGTSAAANKYYYAHDDPAHPLHWMREHKPDSKLDTNKDCKDDDWKKLYDFFHENGYVVFQSCSIKAITLHEIAKYMKSKKQGRIQDAWKYHPHVAKLGVDTDLMQFIEYLHGGRRRIFPFQTLNFPKGTQQDMHSDLVHFDTLPQRGLMTAAWTALQDMTEDNGPLKYYPGSHQRGLWDFDEMDLWKKVVNNTSTSHLKKGSTAKEEYEYLFSIYGKELEDVLQNELGMQPAYGSDLKYGQTLIWAASLIHGGGKQNDMSQTRLSQVTHYYFEGANDYWAPRMSKLQSHLMFIRDQPNCPHDTTTLAFKNKISSQYILDKKSDGYMSSADCFIDDWIQKANGFSPIVYWNKLIQETQY